MQIVVYNQDGSEVEKIEINEEVFNQKVNESLIHRALRYQLANARIAIADTKTRWERRGSTRKLYRQKGTGRARVGSARSPIRKKWGVVFGPSASANFSIAMNRKERRKALFSLLSAKVRDNRLVVLDKLELKEMKTKPMIWVISALNIDKKVLIALPSANDVIEKSTSNIPTAKTILADYLNIKDLLKYETLLVTKESLNKIEEVFVK